MEKITAEGLIELFEKIAAVMDDNCDQLCAMDAEMGDGDLGLTMKQGFAIVPAVLKEAADADLSKKLMKAGMKMSSTVPSTMGTLMASGLMSGGKKLAGKDEMDAAGYAAFLDGFCEGIIKRGKCAEGDRTILDAFAPAAKAAAEALAAGGTLTDVAKASKTAAEQGVERTKEMEPKFGKAAVFKAKAIGKPDQGATAALLFLSTFADYITASLN